MTLAVLQVCNGNSQVAYITASTNFGEGKGKIDCLIRLCYQVYFPAY